MPEWEHGISDEEWERFKQACQIKTGRPLTDNECQKILFDLEISARERYMQEAFATAPAILNIEIKPKRWRGINDDI